MDTLAYLIEKYKEFGADPNKDKITLPIGRHKDLPRLFNELGLKKGVELGVYRGSWTERLLRYIPGVELYGVDAWTTYKGYKDFGDNDIIEAEKMAKELESRHPNCKMIKGYSVDVAPQFEDESLDFVFIDGNHDYQHCVQDLDLWARKVRKGGIVSGHDYDDYSKKSRWWSMHVIDAVDGWCRSYRIKPLWITTKNQNKCWFYVK